MILRWLFLLLLVLNLLLLAWGMQKPQPSRESMPPVPADVPGLELLSETQSVQAPELLAAVPEEEEKQPLVDEKVVESAGTEEMSEAAETGSSVEVVPEESAREAPVQCFELGPFEKEADALEMMDALGEAGHDVLIKVNRTQTQSGYWVLIPAGTEDPDVVVANLESAGVGDVWRFKIGALAGALSLGLYSDLIRAEQRQKDLQERGFNVQIQPRQLEQASFWLQSSYSEKDPVAEAALEDQFNNNPGMSYPPPVCGRTPEKTSVPE